MPASVYPFGYRVPRFATDFHLIVQPEGQQMLLDGRCTDISEDGLGAEMHTFLTTGIRVNLILTIPGLSSSLRVAARVVNRNGRNHGFAFDFSSKTERDHVRQYVRSLQPPSSRP